MKGGRLKIVNESRYPDDEVEALVRFGLSDLDIKGEKLLAVVTDTRSCAYRGWAGRGASEPIRALRRKHNARFVVQMMLGPPEKFPIRPFTRNGVLHDYQTWQEALVGVTAHEGRHVQHYYDGAYETRSGYRKAATMGIHTYRRGGSVRVGVERIEPKCAAHELQMLLRFRDAG